MQKVNFKHIMLFLFVFINAYCLTNVLTDGAYCRHFRINITNSLPYYVFTASPITSVERDMFVSFSHSLSERDLIKQVVGLPGDKISILNQHVVVNGRDCGSIQETSPSGMPLSPIKEEIIPEGYLFVHATHSLSFDSRYAEFGLVSKEWLKERVCPIF